VLTSSMLTVLKPALTQDLTTLETAKDELNITGNDADVRLSRWIRESSGYIATWCNRVFGIEQVSETWRGSERHHMHNWHFGHGYPSSSVPDPLMPRRYPIVTIDSVVEDEGTTLAPTDYEYDAERGRLWRLSGGTSDTGEACLGTRVHWFAAKVVVTYSGGYDVPRSQPYQLEQACLAMLKNRNDSLTRDRMQRSQIIPGVLQEEWWNPAMPGQPGMPPEIAEILAPFREINA
jgi:hypothetical protein